MQTASMIIGGPLSADPVAYEIGDNNNARVRIQSDPASIQVLSTGGGTSITLSNAGGLIPAALPGVAFDADTGPARLNPIATRHVQRGLLWRIPSVWRATALMIRSANRFLHFGFGDGIGMMVFYTAAAPLTYASNPPYNTGFAIAPWTFAGMTGTLADVDMMTRDGLVVIGSERPGNPGSLRVESARGYVELRATEGGNAQIVMTAANKTAWALEPLAVTPGFNVTGQVPY